jgi:hypothetical protein
MGAEAFQALGAGALLTATLTTASLQLTAASIYEKALSGDLPNRLEVWLWRRRRGAIAISMLTLGLGLPMVSGLASYYFELFT